MIEKQDPELSWNTTSPGLTSCILETAFVWIPSGFLWICIPYLIFDIIRSNVNPIRWNAYNVCRLSVSALLTIITLIDFILCLVREFHFEDSPSIAHILSAAIYFITRLSLCLIFYWQRVSGIHCSGIVFLYLLMELFFGTLAVASYSMPASDALRQSHEYALICVEYSLIVILFCFCCFADRLPPNTFSAEKLSDDESRVCPKYLVSFPSKLTFWWITTLIMKGWKNPLTTNDLWDVRAEDRCRNVFSYFNRYWKSDKYEAQEENVVYELGGKGDTDHKYKSIQNLEQSSGKPKKTKLMSIISKAFWFYFVTPSILKLVADVVQLANPMIMK